MGGDAGLSVGEGLRHVVDGTEGDGVEEAGGRHGVDAGGPDFGGESECSNGFAKEGGLFALGLGESDEEIGVEELDGETGKAGSGAKVEKGGAGGQAWDEVEAGEEAFAEVAADDVLGIADGRDVGAGVPLEE